ncbi:hypothetical protein NDU88_005677 [Pleurodeles waltl]|uniref:Uncharacterized protein n=1 Tax=Pleurodeles waltl TaxID=8319 RepID=A0AAV7NN76_PLEWA|nr:hypothetical protein NDU88_005677 [Pleurodeles waltl]
MKIDTIAIDLGLLRVDHRRLPDAFSSTERALDDIALYLHQMQDPHGQNGSAFCHTIGEAIQTYFAENTATTVAQATEWEAFKSVIRGKCIGEVVGVRHTLEKDIESKEGALWALDCEIPSNPALGPPLLEAKEGVAASTEKLCCFDHRAYMTWANAERNKAGTLLVWLVNPTHKGSLILEIVAAGEE